MFSFIILTEHTVCLEKLSECELLANSWTTATIHEQFMQEDQEIASKWFTWCTYINRDVVLLPLLRQELISELEQEQREQQTSSRLIQEHSKLVEDNNQLAAYRQSLRNKLSLIKSQDQQHS